MPLFQDSTAVPRFELVLHYFKGRKQDAYRLVERHGARIISESTPLKRVAKPGCTAIMVQIEAGYTVVERLRDTLNLGVLDLRTGRLQIGLSPTETLRMPALALDQGWRGARPGDGLARPARAPRKAPFN